MIRFLLIIVLLLLCCNPFQQVIGVNDSALSQMIIKAVMSDVTVEYVDSAGIYNKVVYSFLPRNIKQFVSKIDSWAGVYRTGNEYNFNCDYFEIVREAGVVEVTFIIAQIDGDYNAYCCTFPASDNEWRCAQKYFADISKCRVKVTIDGNLVK
jgi:hypothetical protein